MSYRSIGLILFGTLGACLLATACTYQLPMEWDNGGAGNGGAGNGGAGLAGETSTSTSTGAAGLGGSAGAGGGMPAAWWDPAWAHRVKITFKNAGGGELTGFPVMVRLDALLAPGSQASLSGADLRFLDDDGKTILAHEIDSWVPGGNSFVWVQVPIINATDTDHIWLYYGNSAATDVQNKTAVWKDFIGVYHLSPSGTDPIQFADSAGTNPGTWEGNQPGGVLPGHINQAIALDGAHFVHIGDNGNVAANIGQARTAEAWINTPLVREQAIVYQEGECVGWYLGMNASSEYFGSFITDSITPLCATGINEYSVTRAASAGAWHYLTLVVDRPTSEMRLFVDGKLENATSIDNANIADGNGVFRIGSDHDGGAGTFIGMIDEVRVSNGARSAEWIAAQHKSMTDNFLVFKTVD